MNAIERDWDLISRNFVISITYQNAVNTITAPDWNRAGRVHDWRNYVPEDLQCLWPELAMETKLVIFLMAEAQANGEEWD